MSVHCTLCSVQFTLMYIMYKTLCTPQNYRGQKRKEFKEKTNLAQSALAPLLWLLYRPGTTQRPHMYPMPGRAGGMGVVKGCARAVLSSFFIAAILF